MKQFEISQDQLDRQNFLLTQAENYGIEEIQELVLSVFTIEQLTVAYDKDFYLNGSTCGNAFDIVQWDHLAALMSSARMKKTRMVNSYGSRVSLLKSVARHLVTEGA